MMHTHSSRYQTTLAELDASHMRRTLRTLADGTEPVCQVDGRDVVQFCSNNYLGLARHPRLIEAAIEATKACGTSSSASRLITGTSQALMELEEAVAQFKGTERALVFNSGYQANVSILAALLGPDDWVFSDRINHASIVDGCLLSRARLSRYQHNDVADLEKKLQKAPANALKWIVTDTVFSMDGDIAPLTEITELAQRYGARVLVDEAHGTGIFGRRRRSGVCEAYGLTECVDLHMGTFSKGLGGFGAYIAGSGEMMDYLINKARGFIYSTALPPSVVATAHAAIELVQDDPSHTQQLWSNIRYLEQKLIERFGHDGCKALGIPLPLASQIVPVVLGPAETTMRVCEQLLESGLFVQGIRPPTVPDGSSRLRISLSALHTPDQINRLAEALAVCIQPVTP